MFNRKWLGILIVAFMLFNILIATAYAAGSSDLLGQVQKYAQDNGQGIVTDLSNTVANVANLFKSIIAIVGVGLIIWAGVIFGTAHGDPNKILLGKKVLGGFVICLICIFEAEKIVGTIMGFLGFTPGGTL